MSGWRWLFILEGLITIGISFLSYFILVDTPDSVKWLTAEEKRFIQLRLQYDGHEGDGYKEGPFKWKYVRQAFTDSKVYLGCVSVADYFWLCHFLTRLDDVLHCRYGDLCLELRIAHHHQIPGLHRSQCPAVNGPSLHLRLHRLRRQRHPLRPTPNAFSIHPVPLRPRPHRNHHLLDSLTQRATWGDLRCHVLLMRRPVPVHALHRCLVVQ